jgi:hypothetical protein
MRTTPLIAALALLPAIAWAEPDAAPRPPDAPAGAAPVAPPIDADRVELAPSSDVAALLRELRADLAAVRGELRSEIAAIRAEIATGGPLVVGGPPPPVPPDLEHPPPPPAPTGRKMRSVGSKLTIGPGEVVDQAENLGGPIEVRGTVLGDVRSVGGDIRVHETGEVRGNASAVGGDIRVEPGGRLGGSANVVGGKVIVRPGGKLGFNGSMTAMPPVVASAATVDQPGILAGMWAFLASLYQRLIFLLAFAGAGVLVIALMPDRIHRIAGTIAARPFVSGAFGLIGTAIGLILSVILIPTLIGPLVLLSALGVAWMMGFVALCQLIGDRIDPNRGAHGRWIAFLIGSVVVSFVGALPWIGIVTVVAASLLGVGAVLASRYGTTVSSA